MRKFLLLLLVVMTMPACAQNYKYRISSYMSVDGFETYNYQYLDDATANLQGIHKIDLADQMELIDSLVYDEQGRIVSVQTHQLFDYGWRKVCWVDYTYNDKGLRATRKNYNDFNDGWGGILGGTYYYSYNDEGKMTRRELEFDNYLYEIVEYHYNDKGQLEAELAKQDPFIGTFENSTLVEHYYTEEEGYLAASMYFQWSYDWALMGSFVQQYDSIGNCNITTTFSADGIPQERSIYEYDYEVSADEIFHFSNPENSYPLLPQMKNKVDSYEYWLIQQSTGNLVYVRDYLFLYDEIEGGDDDDDDDNDTTSVNNISVNTRIYPNPTSNYVMIESEEVDHVQVLDICGRELFATEVRGAVAIDMTEYEAGVYFVRLHSNGSTSVQKVVKK